MPRWRWIARWTSGCWALAMREANGDFRGPRRWCGTSPTPRGTGSAMSYGGAAVAVDNPGQFQPRNPDLMAPARYEIDDPVFAMTRRSSASSSRWSPIITPGLAAIIGALTLQQSARSALRCRAPGDGDGEGRAPVARCICRPSRAASRSIPATARPTGTSGPAKSRCAGSIPPPGWHAARRGRHRRQAIIADMPAWVHFWSHFKDDFLGLPAPHIGWWGPMAAMVAGAIWRVGAYAHGGRPRRCW